MTHSFPINDSDIYFGKYDCTAEQKNFLDQYIEETAYEDYDKLIQLCDAISLPFTLVKWKAFMELKKYFDGKCGCNICSFLPNVMENSFDSLIYTA